MRSIAAFRSGRWSLATGRLADAGSPDADPYSVAMLARTGEVPLGAGEGLAFTADGRHDGEPLVGVVQLPGRRPDAGGAPVDADRL